MDGDWKNPGQHNVASVVSWKPEIDRECCYLEISKQLDSKFTCKYPIHHFIIDYDKAVL